MAVRRPRGCSPRASSKALAATTSSRRCPSSSERPPTQRSSPTTRRCPARLSLSLRPLLPPMCSLRRAPVSQQHAATVTSADRPPRRSNPLAPLAPTRRACLLAVRLPDAYIGQNTTLRDTRYARRGTASMSCACFASLTFVCVHCRSTDLAGKGPSRYFPVCRLGKLMALIHPRCLFTESADVAHRRQSRRQPARRRPAFPAATALTRPCRPGVALHADHGDAGALSRARTSPPSRPVRT